MKKYMLLLLLIFAGRNLHAQCLSGDCLNGYGEMAFPSGNRYKGGFKDGRFGGQGEMQYASGNVIKATFVESIPTVGTFYYANEKTLFRGTFKADGTPRSGVYESACLDGKVTVSEGTITEVKHPVADSLRADHIAN